MKRLIAIAVAVTVLAVGLAPAFAALDLPTLSPKGIEGPDIRAKLPPKGLEGPDIRNSTQSPPQAIERPDVR